jgi:hypothetical protein
MRVLLDAGIFMHSRFAEPAVSQSKVHLGAHVDVVGVVRKAPDPNSSYQRQIDALFTVGRLIREGQIEAFKYWEVECEVWRGNPELSDCNALQGCNIKTCLPALPRSKLFQTIEFQDAISKGGKKDCEAGIALSPMSQIAFFKWLIALSDDEISLLISEASRVRLSKFDVESLRNFGWFKFLCQRSQSPENYPDIFHLWTAERNGHDALLTLEERLPKLISRVKSEKRKIINIKTDVLRPLQLLQKFGIRDPDPVPMAHGRFYHLHEIPDD